MKDALEGNETSNYELEFETKTKQTVYLLVNATSRRDTDGTIVGVVGVAQDVTEAKNNENAITAVARELRQLVDTANAPIFGIDKNGLVNEWNNKTAEITGFSRKEAFGRSLVSTFIKPNLRDNVQNVLLNALKGDETSNYELEFETKTKDTVYLLVNATSRRDTDGTIVGVVGVAQDVTKAKNNENAITAVARELRQLVDTANAPIFGIDKNGLVNEWNNKTAEITGFSRHEAFNRPLVSTFIKSNLRDNVQNVLLNALKGDETSNYELEFETKAKGTRYLLVNATTRRDPDGTIVGVVGVAQDVTDDKNHINELQKMHTQKASQEAKVETERNMTAYFAHELRNPLHAIDIALSIMPDNIDEESSSLVKSMKLCASFMSSIMNNLLDVRKMEEGKMTLNNHPTNVKQVIKSVQDMLRPSVRKGVQFTCNFPQGTESWILADSHRLQQVYTNVITNAIKYTMEGKIELVFYWDEAGNGIFECRDTGPGIPLGQQQELFRRFVQRGGAPGTGLGLAIAKHLVDLAGGSIKFVSDPTTKPGTDCIVTIPFRKCEVPEINPTMKVQEAIKEALRFLIIDDITMNRTMLRKRLLKNIAPNSTVQEAVNGEEALKIVAESEKEGKHFDVIVVDQYMEEAGGVMVGTDVVLAMRRNGVSAIIIGCSGNDIEHNFMDAGCQAVWKKPMPNNQDTIAELKRFLANRPYGKAATKTPNSWAAK
ncbi:hypothetical protein TrST_g1281 [Triparma strigata]|uniref:histidine kinase n=1 Tax=Triparma strigata TaxID=1606541 RepID=A0A9W7DT76_9STRA|nr:hypothetical protein TrST_g1281 [Triparma strigata]